MSNALINYINEKNAKTDVWVAEVAGRWACGLVADAEHWAAAGVTTPEELEKYLLACDVYESTRNVWGYKPSWGGLMSLSLAELQAEMESLAAAGRAEREREQREEQAKRDARARATTRVEWTLENAFPA
jgi:hypothetical protein